MHGVIKNMLRDELLNQKSRAKTAEGLRPILPLTQTLGDQSQREWMEKEFPVLTFFIGPHDHVAAGHIAYSAYLVTLGLEQFG